MFARSHPRIHDTVIVTSGPTATYPQLAYRTSLHTLLKFLNDRHGSGQWAIWEFRAEGAGYPDEVIEAAGSRVWHFPWPDHHPPPFALVPRIMASMRDWLGNGNDNRAVGDEDGDGSETGRSRSEDKSKRTVVLHCKAGKGRSGTVTCAYLVAEEGWKLQDALARFTHRRMRPNFGAGVSIPSQLRYLNYVDRWVRTGKVYVERCIEILEVHVWGLREGVSIALGGYSDEGKKINMAHRLDSDKLNGCSTNNGGYVGAGSLARAVVEVMSGNGRGKKDKGPRHSKTISTASATNETHKETSPVVSSDDSVPGLGLETAGESAGNGDLSPLQSMQGKDIVYKPSERIIIPTNDIHISLERRTTPSYGFAVVTSLAHVWFNTFFESCGPEECQARQLHQFEQLQRSDAMPKNPSGSVSSTASIGDKDVLELATAGSKPINADNPANGTTGNGVIYKDTAKDANENPSPLPSTSSTSSSGVYTIPWHALDGLKGTSRKGTRALDSLAIVWRALDPGERIPGQQEQKQSGKPLVVKEPAVGEEISDTGPVDWRPHDVKVGGEAVGKKEGKGVDNDGDVATAHVSSISVAGIIAHHDDATKVERTGVKSHINEEVRK